MSHTWKYNCTAQHIVESQLISGELHKDAVPKTTWESHAELKIYKLSTFCSHIYKMKTKYGSVIVSHVPTSTNETEDEDGEDLIDNPGASLTLSKRSIGKSESGNERDISPFNNYSIAPWLYPETGRKYTDAFILLPSGISDNHM